MTDRLYDVAVVGAGPIGSATARHLAETGVAVVVVGPEDPAGTIDPSMPWSGWSDESRMFHAIDVPLPSAILARRARNRFADIEERSGIDFVTAHEAITVSVDRPGKHLDGPESRHHSDLDLLLSNAADLGVPIERMDDRELARRYPAVKWVSGAVGLRQPQGLVLNPRTFVAAQLTLAHRAGIDHVASRVVAIREDRAGVQLETTTLGTVRARKVVVAAGPYINLDQLLPRQLDTGLMGMTVALARVPENTMLFPTLMYSTLTSEVPFAGLIVPPIRYPDGKWYVKATGIGAMEPLPNDAAAVQEWVYSGGDAAGAEQMIDPLTSLVPDLQVEAVVTKPCLVTENRGSRPYIGQVTDSVVVATEGEHGVTIADEVGRLAADLVRKGVWQDALPAELFQPEFI